MAGRDGFKLEGERPGFTMKGSSSLAAGGTLWPFVTGGAVLGEGLIGFAGTLVLVLVDEAVDSRLVGGD